MIGLLTPYRIYNFGTKLQAYAVQQVLGRVGQAEVLDWVPSVSDRLIHKPESMRNMRYLDFKPSAQGNVDPTIQRARRAALDSFDELLVRSRPLVGRHALKKHAHHYDAIVCGSDQIWNPINLARHVFMLEFAPATVRKVAFSPSFGIEELPPSLWKTYRRRLTHLDAISVRERSGADILCDLGFPDVPVTLDPTLVVPREEWADLAQQPHGLEVQKGTYLFCYFLGNREHCRSVAQTVAHERGLQIVAIPHFKGYVEADESFGDVRLGALTPQGFLWLARHAGAVCTDSFHGCVFATLFERELFYCPRHEESDGQGTNTRVASLLDELGMADRVIRSEQMLGGSLQSATDYRAVEQILTERRAATWTYLQSALDGIR